MQHIQNLLARFKRLTLPDEAARKTIVEVCKKEFHVPIEMKDITIRNRVVFISGSPHAKMTLYMQKKRILSILKERLGNEAPVDFR